jgi:hypothetical protein
MDVQDNSLPVTRGGLPHGNGAPPAYLGVSALAATRGGSGQKLGAIEVVFGAVVQKLSAPSLTYQFGQQTAAAPIGIEPAGCSRATSSTSLGAKARRKSSWRIGHDLAGRREIAGRTLRQTCQEWLRDCGPEDEWCLEIRKPRAGRFILPSALQISLGFDGASHAS